MVRDEWCGQYGKLKFVGYSGTDAEQNGQFGSLITYGLGHIQSHIFEPYQVGPD